MKLNKKRLWISRLKKQNVKPINIISVLNCLASKHCPLNCCILHCILKCLAAWSQGVTTGHVMKCHVTICHVKSGHVLCDMMSCDKGTMSSDKRSWDEMSFAEMSVHGLFLFLSSRLFVIDDRNSDRLVCALLTSLKFTWLRKREGPSLARSLFTFTFFSFVKKWLFKVVSRDSVET